jgi:hypothetical protein
MDTIFMLLQTFVRNPGGMYMWLAVMKKMRFSAYLQMHTILMKKASVTIPRKMGELFTP